MWSWRWVLFESIKALLWTLELDRLCDLTDPQSLRFSTQANPLEVGTCKGSENDTSPWDAFFMWEPLFFDQPTLFAVPLSQCWFLLMGRALYYHWSLPCWNFVFEPGQLAGKSLFRWQEMSNKSRFFTSAGVSLQAPCGFLEAFLDLSGSQACPLTYFLVSLFKTTTIITQLQRFPWPFWATSFHAMVQSTTLIYLLLYVLLL